MGSLFGGSNTTKTDQTTNTGPSQFQLPYLQTAFNGAQNLFNSQSGTPYYQGELYAGMSEAQKAALQGQVNFATGTGLSSAADLTKMGQGLLGNGAKAQGLLDQYTSLANTDATGANIKAASQYADNPYLDGQIDAVNRDVSRQLTESTLPSIDRSASGTGNLNSSRAGVAAGIAQRGAADRMADNAASLRGQAYSQGLNLASQDRSTNLNALATGASGYAGLANQGLSAISAGNQLANNSFGVINNAYSQEQADRQGQTSADFQKWQGNDQRQWDILNRYYGMVGGNQWGQSGTTTGTQVTKQNQGLLGGLAGLATTGLGLAGGLGWKPFN
ncbi:hypothetical protein [Sphingomonas desiccabilis]|uniref:Uncharacterized protein n=1 Tax=Sphingomonas desiccabilis TaxID=429134 RepID=A0A4Q2J005_9SPHN|nr:hypothetical protein [Sphingomonas desiccabilis]MBB3910155.1 hypothetical protein [Sphingomonas desiccabilis]RXZ34834.1 hypothetical protein EO081_04020 [Sphingomonas desiccabilis]